MNFKVVEAVYPAVTGGPGHLDQYPYIDSWLGFAQDPPTWTRFCIQKGKGKILIAQKLTDDETGNSTGLDRDDLTPRLPPSAPPGPEAALLPNPGPGEVPAAATAPLPAPPEVVEPPPQQASIPVTEAFGQHFQDQAPAEPPKLYLSLPVSTDKKGRERLGLSRNCALPESRRERKRTDKRFAMLAAALGRSILGPLEGQSFNRSQWRPQAPLQPNQCGRC